MTVLYFKTGSTPHFSEPIETHINYINTYVFRAKEIYYKKEFNNHGIQHAIETAILAKLLFSFYQQFHDNLTNTICDDFIKYLQIACLLHDAGRESDAGVDHWDNDSGNTTYHYLMASGVSNEKAGLFASTIASKDTKERGPFRIYSPHFNNINPTFLLARELLHNADCLQIMRAREHFDGEQHLNRAQLYRNNEFITQYIDNQFSLFITATRGFMYETGSHMASRRFARNHWCDSKLFNTLHSAALKLSYFKTLLQNNHGTPHETKAESEIKTEPEINIIKEPGLWQADDEQYYVRAITNPAQLCTLAPYYKATSYELERYKQGRTGDDYTQLRTKKNKKRSEKHGARYRSVSYIYNQHALPSCVTGALELHHINHNQQKPISMTAGNIGTGTGSDRKRSKHRKPLKTPNKAMFSLKMARLNTQSGIRSNNEIVLTWLSSSTLYALAWEDGHDVCIRRGRNFAHKPELNEAISFIRVMYMYFLHSPSKPKLFRYSATDQSLVAYTPSTDTLFSDIINSWKIVINDAIKNADYFTSNTFLQFRNSKNAFTYLSNIFKCISEYHFYFGTKRKTKLNIISHYPLRLQQRLKQLLYHEIAFIESIKNFANTKYSELAKQSLGELVKIETQIQHGEFIPVEARVNAWMDVFHAVSQNTYPWEQAYYSQTSITDLLIQTVSSLALVSNNELSESFKNILALKLGTLIDQWKISLDDSELDLTPLDLISASKFYPSRCGSDATQPENYSGNYYRKFRKHYLLNANFTLIDKANNRAMERIAQLRPDLILDQLEQHYSHTKARFHLAFQPLVALSAYCTFTITAILLTKFSNNTLGRYHISPLHVIFTIPIIITLIIGIKLLQPSKNAIFSKQESDQQEWHPHSCILYKTRFTLFHNNRTSEDIDNVPCNLRHSIAKAFDGAIIQGRQYYRDNTNSNTLWYRTDHNTTKKVDYLHLRTHIADPLNALRQQYQALEETKAADSSTPLLDVTVDHLS